MRTLLTSVFAFVPGAALADLNVVASFSVLGDITSQIGGENITVTTLVGADEDAHVYSPTVGDARAIASADLVFLNGLGFEEWAEQLVAASGTTAPIVTVADNLPKLIHNEDEHGDEHDDHDGHDEHGDDHDDEHDDEHKGHDDHDDHGDEHDDHKDHATNEMDAHAHHDHGEFDPHAWGSIANVIVYADAVRDALSETDPENASSYDANYDAYVFRLTAMKDSYTARIDALPVDHRVVVTAHDAFGYLAEETGLTFLAPLGISSGAAASAAEVRDLITFLKTLPKAALFVESVKSPALIDQIAAETGFTVGGTLYSDALSGPEGPASTYEAMYQHNMEAILGQLEN